VTEQYPEQQDEHDSVANQTSEDQVQQMDAGEAVAGETGMPQGPDVSEHDEEPQGGEPQQDEVPERDGEFDAASGTTPDPQREPAPETGDIVIDSALRDLQSAPADDLDAQIAAGQQVHRTLQARLSDLGGE
jgi:hypothetical protein